MGRIESAPRQDDGMVEAAQIGTQPVVSMHTHTLPHRLCASDTISDPMAVVVGGGARRRRHRTPSAPPSKRRNAGQGGSRLRSVRLPPANQTRGHMWRLPWCPGNSTQK